MILKKDYIYYDETEETYFLVLENNSKKAKDYELFNTHVMNLSGPDAGKTNNWISDPEVDEIGHKDLYPEYFI